MHILQPSQFILIAHELCHFEKNVVVTPLKLALTNPVEPLAIHPVEPMCGQIGNRPYKNCQSKCKEGE
jgi:hypothetical protein